MSTLIPKVRVVEARADRAEALCDFLRRRDTPIVGCCSTLEECSEDTVLEESDYTLVGADLLKATLDELRRLRGELAKARSDMDDRKVVDRAKGLLMDRKGMTEPQAYRALQKLAMDRKVKIAEVARNVIDMADLFAE